MKFFKTLETAGTIYLAGTGISTLFFGIVGTGIGVKNGIENLLKPNETPEIKGSAVEGYLAAMDYTIYSVASFLYAVGEGTVMGAAVGAAPILYPTAYIYNLYDTNTEPKSNTQTETASEEDDNSVDCHNDREPSLRGSRPCQ